MKPILFAKDETDFTTNGLGRLDCISCNVIEERNGIFELEAEIPITGAHAREIEQQSIIGAKTHDGGNIQAFSVYKITKPISGRFMVYARHISYRLSDIPCSPFSIAASPQAAADTLAGLKSHALEVCPFNFSTDVTTGNSYNQITPASIRQRLGGIEGSVIDQFGGEYEFDNWDVKLWKSRGRLANTTGISLRYGKNITDIEQEEEIANTVTGVVPFWIDTDGNNLVTLPEWVVYADNADQYPYHITQVLDLSGSFQDKPTVNQLRGVANTYVHKDGFGVPKVSIKVSFRNLWESEEYKDIAPLERVQLCDEISVYFEKLGISAIAKVVKTDYDVLKERYNNIEVGNLRTTLAQAVTDRDKDIDTTFIQEMTRVSTAIMNATAWLTNANGYVVAVKNTDGSWKELLLMNTNDPQTATQGIRFNNNGLGFFNKVLHPDGNILTGPYDMAWTLDGRLGDFVNKNYWNFITGEFALSPSTTVGGKTVDAIAQEKADAAETAAENTAAQALAAQVAIYDADIADLQNQIDGNVTTWYYSGTPTLNNLPASEWTTTTDKDNHIGDIYYDSVTGYAYRFMKDGNNYVWTKISDSDIEAALAEAQDAWDLADHKRRIFVTTPVPPYDVGDLWVQGDGGDIKRCAVAKTDTQTYAAEDWVLASKYTDDTALTTWINNTYSSDKIDIKAQIDQRAETFYQPNDPSIEWGSTINFNSQCRTESIEWDWIDIYYRKSNGTYEYVRRGGKFEGPINIPSTEFWIYWHTDNSQHNYYGWKVDSVVKYAGTSYTTPTGSANALPSYGTMDLPIEQLESTHPYTDGINIVYHSYLVNHEGDLWYRTTDNTTWRFNGYTWEQQDIPMAVFDEIDGKAQIFTTQPTPPYNVGDLWCEGATGDILTCITAKSSDQSYSASDWSKRNKYTDDTTVNTLDNNLNQSGLMYRLTNGTKSEGIYLEDGHIYINISRAEIGTMSADRIYGGALMLGGLNDTRGQLIAMGIPNVETAYSLYSGQTGSWYSEPLIDGMLWINVTSTSAPTGTSCGRARLNNGEWIDLYSGSNFIGYYTSITLEYNASYNYSAQIVTAGALARIDNGGIIAEQINAKGGYIGDLTLADGELYVRGEYNLNNQNVSVTKSAKNIRLKSFKPYKLYIKESSFKLVLDYTISASVSRTIQLQTQRYDYSSRVWTTIDTQTLNNAAGSYTVEVNRTFYNDETDLYRIRIAINKVTSTSNFNISTHLYINNVTKVSVSSDGIWGNFYGVLNGSADLDNANIGDIYLEGTTVSGSDSNSDAYFTLNDQLLTMYDIDGNHAYFDHNGIDCEDRANSEATITINHDYMYVSSSNTRYARCSYSGLNLHVDSNNYCIFNRYQITAVDEGSSYYVDWQQGSDERIKEEIEPLNIELSKNLIDATETKKFRYKSGGGKHYGMIAQEARKLLDDLGEAEAELEYGPKVHNDDIPNYRAIRYEEYIPHIINYIKDLRAVVDRQQAEIDQLKEIVKKLSM